MECQVRLVDGAAFSVTVPAMTSDGYGTLVIFLGTPTAAREAAAKADGTENVTSAYPDGARWTVPEIDGKILRPARLASAGNAQIVVARAAHMTRRGFDRLLKTVEEPPSGAKFWFCASSLTEFPATIISRVSAVLGTSVGTAGQGSDLPSRLPDPFTATPARDGQQLLEDVANRISGGKTPAPAGWSALKPADRPRAAAALQEALTIWETDLRKRTSEAVSELELARLDVKLRALQDARNGIAVNTPAETAIVAFLAAATRPAAEPEL